MMASDDDMEGSALPTSLLDRLSENAAATPDKIAMTYLGSASGSFGGAIEKEMTYADVVKETDALSVSLLGLGLNKGDMVVLVYPPSLDFMIAFLACLKAGVVAVPVFPPQPARKDTLFMFSRIVSSCGAKYALTSAKYNHAKNLSSIKDAFTRFTRSSNTTTWPDQLEWVVTDTLKTPKKSSAVASGMDGPSSPRPSTDLAFLQYTSGSTSEPKGVMITQANLASNLSKITTDLKATQDTVVVSWLPQYHDMGLIGSFLGVLYCGGSGYYMSPLTFLQQPMMWIEAVSQYSATHLQAPNFAFKLTARKFDASSYSTKSTATSNRKKSNWLDLSSVRHIINAAEPVTAESIDAFQQAFAPFGLPEGVIFPTYGLAEHTVFVCSGGKQRLTVSKQDLEVHGIVNVIEESTSSEITTQESKEDATTTRLMGCGYPARSRVDVRIVDIETMLEVAENEVGEIWIRSRSKAAGYYNKPAQSKMEFCARIGASPPDASEEKSNDEEREDLATGYLRSGDLGFLHNGELFVCGRIKDLIIVGGRNYYPQDIELTAEGSVDSIRPGCSAAFTVDPISGKDEEVALVLELREAPKSKDSEEVCVSTVEAIRSAISQEHSLSLAHIVLLRPRTIPKTTSGKIARARCRKAFASNTLDVVYHKSLKETQQNPSATNPLEIEQGGTSSTPSAGGQVRTKKAKEIRKLEKDVISKKLSEDISRLTSVPLENIGKNVPLTTMLDSLTMSQFKGMLEGEYATKLSDEYLFRETTTVEKLVEVVKLGYAPDDTNEGEPGSVPTSAVQSGSGGMAQALGCPPGVVCCVVM